MIVVSELSEIRGSLLSNTTCLTHMYMYIYIYIYTHIYEGQTFDPHPHPWGCTKLPECPVISLVVVLGVHWQWGWGSKGSPLYYYYYRCYYYDDYYYYCYHYYYYYYNYWYFSWGNTNRVVSNRVVSKGPLYPSQTKSIISIIFCCLIRPRLYASERRTAGSSPPTVDFHNFNLRTFKLSLESEQINCGCFF